jgi:hypothetical protein
VQMAFVGGHDAPDMAGQAAFEAAYRFVVGPPGGDLGVVVGASAAGPDADLGDRDLVQGEVELAVTAARQPVPGAVGADDLHRATPA